MGIKYRTIFYLENAHVHEKRVRCWFSDIVGGEKEENLSEADVPDRFERMQIEKWQNKGWLIAPVQSCEDILILEKEI